MNVEIYTANQALTELAKRELPVKVSYGLAKIKIAISKPFQAIEEIRTGLVRKYGKEDKETGTVNITPGMPDFGKFQEDYSVLMQETADVTFEKVTLPLEVDGKALQVTTEILLALTPFVDVE